MSNTIYDLELHEIMDVAMSYSVMRVPGGWIYSPIGTSDNAVFVPFDNEFQLTNSKAYKDLEAKQAADPCRPRQCLNDD